MSAKSWETRLFRDTVIMQATGEPIRWGGLVITGVDPLPRTERGCIEWPYALGASGYAVMAGETVTRQVLTAVVGPAPAMSGRGAFACHHCDNPPCINPDHLYWGDQSDNSRDFYERGRNFTVGEGNGNATLTEEDVHKIDYMLSLGVSQAHIASAFGVGQTTVAAIRSRRIWSHVEPRVELPAPRIRRRKREC